jgi:hypothetical protein
MAEHARLSPSGAHRWINCPPSLKLEEPFPNTSSKYALEGSGAHEVSRLCLIGEDVDPYTHVNVLENGETILYPVDDDMKRHAKAYRDVVLGHLTRVDGDLLVERRVNFGSWIDVPGQFGTADAVVLGSQASQELVVIDYKYGIGVPVSPEDNEQLMLYALGALYEYDALGDWETVTMVIHQPRSGDGEPKAHTITVAELLAFGVKARDAAALAVNGQGEYAPGEKTCRFCRAKLVCPANQKELDESVTDDFAALVASEAGPTPELLGRYMDRVGMIEDWCKAVRAETERRLVQGLSVPGWKLVRGRQGDRNWVSAEDAEAKLKALKVKAADAYVRKVINPTAAERLLKKSNPAAWEKLQPLITRAEGKLSVAPATDPRPAESASVATDDFRHLIEA